MSTNRLSASPLILRLGEAERRFRRLSRRDFGAIIEHMPASAHDRMYLTPFDVHRWAGTVEGAAVVLAVSVSEPGADVAELIKQIKDGDGWGSITKQATVAATITAESLTIGDEPDETPQEGKKRPNFPPETGQKKPS